MMRHAAGFTLVEALVAVTLLALLFGALMPVFHNGLAVLQSGERHTRAVMLARSVLERQRVAALVPGAAVVDEGGDQGRMEDFDWQVTRAPFIDDATREAESAAPIVDDAASAPFVLQQISVVVHWPGNESGVQLHTLVLVNRS